MISKSNKENRAIEKVLYSKVAEEIESKNINKGLWAKALSETPGDISATEALYIKLRVQNLIDEESFAQDKKINDLRRKHADERTRVLFKIVEISIICFILILILVLLLTL